MSLTVPITNSLAFLFTVVGEWWVEGKVISRGELAGLVRWMYARWGTGLRRREGVVLEWKTVLMMVWQIHGSGWRLCWVGSRFACSRRIRRFELEAGVMWGLSVTV